MVVLATATILGGFWGWEVVHGLERSKTVRLNTLARATRVSVENMLKTGSLDDLQSMVSRLEELSDIVGVLIVNREAEPMILPNFSPSPSLKDAVKTAELPTTVWSQQEGWLARVLPLVSSDGERIGALAVVQDWKDMAAQRRTTLMRVAQGGVILAAIVALALWAAVRVMVARPLALVSGVVDAIAQGETGESTRVEFERNDEIGRLGAALNQMQEQLERARAELDREHQSSLELERSMHASERLAAVGGLAAGIAHEIGTALNVVQGRAQLLLEGPGGKGSGENELATIVKQCERISKTVRRMLDFSRAHESEPIRCDLNDIVGEALELLAPETKQVRLEVELAEAIPKVQADRVRIREVIVNLVLNALHVIDGDGQLRVSTRASASASASASVGEGFAELSVGDDGPGIPAEIRERIFDPFFTTKPAGEGTGLGLAITANIVSEHGGAIEVESEAGAGACFHVYLRYADASAVASREAPDV